MPTCSVRACLSSNGAKGGIARAKCVASRWVMRSQRCYRSLRPDGADEATRLSRWNRQMLPVTPKWRRSRARVTTTATRSQIRSQLAAGSAIPSGLSHPNGTPLA